VTRLHEQANACIPAYVAEYGLVDPNRQAPGEHGWYVLIDLDRKRHVRSGDGWAVPDRDVFTRAAALRTAPTSRPAPAPVSLITSHHSGTRGSDLSEPRGGAVPTNTVRQRRGDHARCRAGAPRRRVPGR
jgi:hypothetical protein